MPPPTLKALRQRLAAMYSQRFSQTSVEQRRALAKLRQDFGLPQALLARLTSAFEKGADPQQLVRLVSAERGLGDGIKLAPPHDGVLAMSMRRAVVAATRAAAVGSGLEVASMETRRTPVSLAPRTQGSGGRGVTKPRDFAVTAHGTQRYGTEPYVVHLEATVRALHELGFAGEKLETAAWLHDVVEDTRTTPAAIGSTFGPEVRRIVEEVTARLGATDQEYFAGMSAEALAVKLADRLTNARALGTTAESPTRQRELLAKYTRQLPVLAEFALQRGGAVHARAVEILRSELDAASARLNAMAAAQGP